MCMFGVFFFRKAYKTKMLVDKRGIYAKIYPPMCVDARCKSYEKMTGKEFYQYNEGLFRTNGTNGEGLKRR